MLNMQKYTREDLVLRNLKCYQEYKNRAGELGLDISEYDNQVALSLIKTFPLLKQQQNFRNN